MGGELDHFAQQHEAPLVCQPTVRVTTLSSVRLHTLKWKGLIQCQFKEKKNSGPEATFVSSGGCEWPPQRMLWNAAAMATSHRHGRPETFDLHIHRDVWPGDEGLFGSRVPLPVQGPGCHAVTRVR